MFALDRLEALNAVWRHGSLAAAARVLHVTPSAVSQQLAKLEREVGADLLVRHGRGVRLTPAGLVLAQRAERVLDEIRAARSELAALAGEVAGPIHVGAIPSGVHTIVTTAVTALVSAHPRVEPTIAEVEPEQALARLADGTLDVAVVESWENLPLPRQERTAWTRLLDEPVHAALPRDHRLAGARSVAVRDLAEETWVGWSSGSRAHQWLEQTLRGHGVADPRIRYTVNGFSTQFAVIANLSAVALIPSMAFVVAPPTVTAVPLLPALRRTLYAVRSHVHSRPAVTACLTALTDAALAWSPPAHDPA
ncbi:LysR family transcriptional regulator [Actinokineospora guangxiensis]|uniref:LysR family transcriptional regulator n=1 Tax=Actinokineospora guangxiensis TaxID=1490288 RepID=A0ABW0EYD5_9PSEU